MVKVIIIGGGFAGINVAKALKGSPLEIVILDRTNHHVFQPLLYQVATASLFVSNIAAPIREMLGGQHNIEVLMAKVDRIDKVGQKIYTSDGKSFFYDFLIVAPGMHFSYFGHDQWAAFAPGLKTLADSVRIREKIILSFEKAECCDNPQEAQKYLRFAVIGAGSAGIAMAGSIAECARRTLRKDFRHINTASSKIYLIEGANQVLPTYPPYLAQKAQKDLEKLGVEILLNTWVTGVTAEGVYMGDQFLATPNVIWAAGNQASPLVKTLNVPLDQLGRVIVNSDLTIPDYPNVFVIGDAAHNLNDQGTPLSPIAPVAIQQGRYVAKIIKKDLPPQKRKPFVYSDRGTITTISRGKAVAMIYKLQLSGLIAWLIWCFVHIFYLVSFRHRLLIMMQWCFLYLLGRRQARVVIRPIDRQ